MVAWSTGPVERGSDTDRVRVVAFNTGWKAPVPVAVVIRCLDLPAGCPGPFRGRPRRWPLILARRRVVLPGRTAVFDAPLGDALRYEVRIHTPSRRVLFYVFGYREGRWWPGTVTDPATTFRHGELVPIRPELGHARLGHPRPRPTTLCCTTLGHLRRRHPGLQRRGPQRPC
ncbi:MAG TPA: hypothetical protein VKZ69_09610 [Limnochordales bacterium]|nr:hypothetical protein [Limnochordales bacterium]